MKSFLTLIVAMGIVGLLSPASAVQTGIKHAKTKAPVVSGGGPVTRAEAVSVLSRLRDMMADILEAPAIKKQPIHLSGTGPVTRDEVVMAFDHLVDVSKNSFKISTPEVQIVPEALVTKKPDVKQAMTRLTKGGFINRVGVLLCGPSETIDIPQFGDAVGFFLCRIADLSHLPSAKWSPGLMRAE